MKIKEFKLNQFLKYFVLIALFLTYSCTDNDDNASNFNTTLKLTIKDNVGNIVSGVTVKLYNSQTDWNNDSNQIGISLVSDVNGKVVFSNLINSNYYFKAEKDCSTNNNTVFNTTSPLILNQEKNIDVNIIENLNGTIGIGIRGATNGTYNVFIDNVFAFDLNGGETKYKSNVASGVHNYSIRQGINEVNGVATIDCNRTNTITYIF